MKIPKKAGLHIAFTTRNTIGKLLTYKMDQPSDKYEASGVYQLMCLEYHKHYVGQTGRHSELDSKNTHKTTGTEITDQILQSTSWIVNIPCILLKTACRSSTFLVQADVKHTGKIPYLKRNHESKPNK
jgi:hypothetical protein